MRGFGRDRKERTELLLDDLEDLLLIEFLGKTLDSSQRLTTIALYIANRVSMLISRCGVRLGAVLGSCTLTKLKVHSR